MTKEIDTLLSVEHHFSQGVYAKQMRIPKGFKAESHAHVYDHLSILASGEVWVTVDGMAQNYKAPATITIAKDKIHLVYAVADSVWFCVHATDITDPLLVDQVLIKGD